jgi:hypothetical protein
MNISRAVFRAFKNKGLTISAEASQALVSVLSRLVLYNFRNSPLCLQHQLSLIVERMTWNSRCVWSSSLCKKKSKSKMVRHLHSMPYFL